mmetsp:Transcript_11200/g.33109  ORF Transcript_11200/g.33109 Transcript_11200/m.33109 type:complete len:220 (+) Transcript_11200:556-1215(+)
MPAALRLCTALSVNMLPHTCWMAFSMAFLSLASTPSTESWRPAPETPSRSSLLADERTATRSVPLGSFAIRSSTTFAGTAHASTALRATAAHSSIFAGGPPFSASARAFTAWSTAAPVTALRITPKGTANPSGAEKPHFFAMDSSFPEEAALEPAVEASARPRMGTTASAARLIAPTCFGFEPPPPALAFAAPSARASGPTFSTFALPLASTVSRTQPP